MNETQARGAHSFTVPRASRPELGPTLSSAEQGAVSMYRQRSRAILSASNRESVEIARRLARLARRCPELTPDELYRGEWLSRPPCEGEVLERPSLVSTSRSESYVLENFLNPDFQVDIRGRTRVLFRARPNGVRGIALSDVRPCMSDPESEVIVSDVRLTVRRVYADLWNVFRRAPLWIAEVDLEPLSPVRGGISGSVLRQAR